MQFCPFQATPHSNNTLNTISLLDMERSCRGHTWLYWKQSSMMFSMEFLCKSIQTRPQKQISPDLPEGLHERWCWPAEWQNLQGSDSVLKAPKGRGDGVVILQYNKFTHLVDSSNRDPLSVAASQLRDSILSSGYYCGFCSFLQPPKNIHEVDWIN